MNHTGAGTSVPLTSIIKHGTKVPTPKGYKQTKVGVIPEDWDVVKLKDILSKPIKNGYSPVCPEEPNENWVLSLGALSKDRLNINEKKPAPINDKKVKDFLLKDGDFLISRSNTPDRVGFSGVFRSKSNNYSYPDLMMRFRADEKIISISFLEYYLKSSAIMKYLQLSASGSSSTMVKINKKTVENIPVIVCKMKEQQKIAQILITWDDAISKQEALIKAKEKLNKGLMQKLLNGEVRFDGFGEDWKNTKLGQLIGEVSIKNKDKDIDLVLTVSAKHGFISQKDYFVRNIASKDTTNYKIVRRGNFAYNPSRINIGSISYLEEFENGILSPMYVIFQCNDNLINKYFNYWINTHNFNGNLYKYLSGSVRNSLSFKDMSLMKIKLPSLQEQQKIAQVLTLTNKEIGLLKNELEALKEQKRGLMQRLLSGGVRVRI